MSVVTNFIIMAPCGNGDKLKEINSYMEIEYPGKKGFVSISDDSLPSGWYGGTKFLETEMWIGAFNYLHEEGLISFLRSMKWKYEEDVQVCYKEDDEDKFKLIDLFT